MKARDVLLSLSVILVWGFNILVVKVGVSELPPFLLTALRFLLVAALVVPFKREPKGKRGLIILLAIFLGAGHYGLLFVGIKGLGAGVTAIVLQLCVPFSAILASIFYGERMGILGWFGMALAFVGVVLIEGGPAPVDLFSTIMILVSAFCWAFSNIIVKWIGPVDVIGLNAWTALYGAPLLLLMSLFFEHGQIEAMAQARYAGWGAVLYTAIMASIVSYTVWYRLIRRLALNRVVPFNLLTPIIAVLGGWLLLGEPTGWPTFLGGAMTILGVAVIQFRPSPTRRVKA